MLASMSGPLRPGASYESTGYADERIQHDHRPRPCHAGTRVRMPFIMSWLPAVPPSRARRTGRACVLWATHTIMFYAAVAQEYARSHTGVRGDSSHSRSRGGSPRWRCWPRTRARGSRMTSRPSSRPTSGSGSLGPVLRVVAEPMARSVPALCAQTAAVVRLRTNQGTLTRGQLADRCEQLDICCE